MTLISRSYHFVFIHVFKTGGESLAQALLPYARLRDRFQYGHDRLSTLIRWTALAVQRRWGSEVDCGGGSWLTGLHKHATATEVRTALGSRSFQALRSFAVIREPNAWFCSLFNYVLASPEHHHHDLALQGFAVFTEHYILLMEKRQSDHVRDPETGELLVNKLFPFESLMANPQALTLWLQLPKPLQIPRLNTTLYRFTPSQLLRQLSAEQNACLKQWLEPDRQLHQALLREG